MNRSVTRLAVALCAALTIACGGRDQAERDNEPPPTRTPGEGIGTTGAGEQTIKIGGCVTRAEPDGYTLTSIDDAIVGTTGTSGHHQNDPESTPAEPNRGAEQERARNELNVSAEAGRYRLAGDADRIGMHVNREVEVTGRVQPSDENETPATLHVEMIDATGARCGADQRRGNDRGVLPGQDIPR